MTRHAITDHSTPFAIVAVGAKNTTVHAFSDRKPATGLAVCGFKPRANAVMHCFTVSSHMFANATANCPDCVKALGTADRRPRVIVTDHADRTLAEWIVDTDNEAMRLAAHFSGDGFTAYVTNGPGRRQGADEATSEPGDGAHERYPHPACEWCQGATV